MLEISNILKGKFIKSNNSFGFVYVEKIGKYTLDEFNKKNNVNLDELKIYVNKKDSSYAVNNSDVEVKLLDNEENKKIIKQINEGKYSKIDKQSLEGKIIKVKLNENTKIVGTYYDYKNFGFVVPDNIYFESDIYIPKKYRNDAKTKDKVVVCLISNPKENRKLEGKIVEILGNNKDFGIDVLSLIKEAQIPYEFPKDVMEQAYEIEQKVDDSKKEKFKRRDFRGEDIFTIDGDDTKDIDDAICIKRLSDGKFELQVHIADVANYVREDTPLDKEAFERGTSVYLLDRVIPMLPKELSNGICSLNEGQDRYALSCLMVIDKSGNIIESDVCKSIIRVTKKMTYNIVQKILDGDEKTRKEYEKYIQDFDNMAELANILKSKKEKLGYLSLDIPESKIILDKNGKVVDVTKYENKFSNEIIEQFMLAANETIAEKFFFLEAPFIYRTHEKPDYEKIKEANEALWNLDLKIKATPDKIYSYEFEKVLNKAKGTDIEIIVSQIILHTLKLAIYDYKNEGHFGIGAKYYCHFTSPIRRYPDLFIHRIITKYLENNYNVDDSFYEKYNEKAKVGANQSTKTEKRATTLERQVNKLKCCEYMEDKKGETYKGIISSITSFGMFVELPNTIEGLVKYGWQPNYFIYDEDKKEAIAEGLNKIFKIGDRVKILVLNSDKRKQQIDFMLLEDYTNGYVAKKEKEDKEHKEIKEEKN